MYTTWLPNNNKLRDSRKGERLAFILHCVPRPDHSEGSIVCACLVTQSCPTLCNPMDCSPPGSSVHGIFKARILEWVAISYSRGVFLTQGSNLSLASPTSAGKFFTTVLPGKPQCSINILSNEEKIIKLQATSTFSRERYHLLRWNSLPRGNSTFSKPIKF